LYHRVLVAELERDGVRLYYEVHEPREATQHETILLSHGFSSSSHMWEPNLDALTERYRVVTWDLRGHGRSDYPADPEQYREALAVEDMAALLDIIGAQRAIIGGLSLGGYLSLAFHASHPERVAALMLFDTGPGYRRDEGRDGWNRSALANAQAFETRGLDALARRSETRGDVHRDATGLALAARGLLTQHDAHVIESLGSIRVPTLVLVGGEDTPFLGAAEYMASHIAGATKVILDGAGHASNIDRPEAFDRSVLQFLSTIPGPR
jgi:pimeloyl-ACP methyl ester carboxylesterase